MEKLMKNRTFTLIAGLLFTALSVMAALGALDILDDNYVLWAVGAMAVLSAVVFFALTVETREDMPSSSVEREPEQEVKEKEAAPVAVPQGEVKEKEAAPVAVPQGEVKEEEAAPVALQEEHEEAKIEEEDVVPEPDGYIKPLVTLLREDKEDRNVNHTAELQKKVEILRRTFDSFNIKVSDSVDCFRGPSITRFEIKPEPGMRVRSIVNCIDDISLNMSAPVRIEAPIPGKSAVGIEVPNDKRETVFLRTLLESDAFRSSEKPLEVPLGIGVGGDITMCDLAKMPHLLVAGTTGSGKSVCVHTILTSLVFKLSPAELRLILIDPKQVEFAAYEKLPHLYMPIVKNASAAVGVLGAAVQEMERRYSLLHSLGVRDIDNYNRVAEGDAEIEHLPRLVIVIDELADLKMSCPDNSIESLVYRLAQKSRATGIYLIVGTQRPSVDIITGRLKSNIPSRIAFAVKQQVDSRVILDENGAESLTGRGDMLYFPLGTVKPIRLQGAFVSDEEIERVVDFVRQHNAPVRYSYDFMAQADAMSDEDEEDEFDAFSDNADDGAEDPKFREAVELAIEMQRVATSLLQRRLTIGYSRASKMIDRMEALGYVSAPEGNKPRRVLITAEEFAAEMAKDNK